MISPASNAKKLCIFQALRSGRRVVACLPWEIRCTGPLAQDV